MKKYYKNRHGRIQPRAIVHRGKKTVAVVLWLCVCALYVSLISWRGEEEFFLFCTTLSGMINCE